MGSESLKVKQFQILTDFLSLKTPKGGENLRSVISLTSLYISYFTKMTHRKLGWELFFCDFHSRNCWLQRNVRLFDNQQKETDFVIILEFLWQFSYQKGYSDPYAYSVHKKKYTRNMKFRKRIAITVYVLVYKFILFHNLWK